jgi:protein TonB
MRSTFKKNTNNTNKQKTEDITTNIESEVYDVVDFVADFPGGEKAMCQWLAENIEFPSLAIKNGEKGRVVVSFIVEKDGSITDPKIKSSVSPSIDGEALRVIMTMPKWNPAVKNGKTVRTRRQIPITFR